MPYKHERKPGMGRIRLLKALTIEDGIGGGIRNIQDTYLMATAGGKVIVADTDRNQLKMFDDKGLLLKTITGKENDYDAPMHPDGIMCDSQNRIIVADNHNHNMRILDPSGIFVTRFSADGKDGEFDNIKAIRVTGQDNIIVECYKKILMFDSSGKFLDVVSHTGSMLFSKNYMVEESSDYRREIHSRKLYDFTVGNPKKNGFKISVKDITDQLKDADKIIAVLFDDKTHMYMDDESMHVFTPLGEKIKKIQLKHHPRETHDLYDNMYPIVGGLNHEHIITLDCSLASSFDKQCVFVWDDKRFYHFDKIKDPAMSFLPTPRESVACINTEISNEYVVCSVCQIIPHSTMQTVFEIHKQHYIPITTDGMNRMILGDHGRVRILNPNGRVEKTITDADGQGKRFGRIDAVATDRNGRIVVKDFVDSDNQYVRIFDSKGIHMESFADGDTPKKEFERLVEVLHAGPMVERDSHGRVIQGTCVISQYCYYSRITIEDTLGNFVKEIEIRGAHGNLINFAESLTVDKWDRIITVERYSLTIRVFERNGDLVSTIRGTSVGGKNMNEISGITTDRMGRIIISGTDCNDNEVIQIFGAELGLKRKQRGGRRLQSAEDPIHILKVRYAKGKITDEQFEAMKKKMA